MAKCFTTWTVLPHEPIEKHSENLWSVSGNMPSGNQRRMTIVRRADGKLVIHNPIALGEAEMNEVEALGKPGFLIVPNLSQLVPGHGKVLESGASPALQQAAALL